jgi:hypothetical protein
MTVAAAACLALATSAFAADKPAGVIGDGVADDTVAIQKALDDAGKTGGEVYLPPGLYLIKSSLSVPTGVCLRGSWDMAHHGAWDKGSTLLCTGGRGNEAAPAAVQLQQSSAIKGFTMVWPEQKIAGIVPYPWAIQGTGMHNTVEDVTFVNAYNGISVGRPGWSELHLIRNVFGCVLRRGVMVDGCSDIGRIENVHFNPHYWVRSRHPSVMLDKDHSGDPVEYMKANLEAFIFARTDWEYVLNTFVYAAKVGYRFTQFADGACNGQFVGIGADCCKICVEIDRIQDIGIQVTNGEFTSFAGEPNTAIVTNPGARGTAQFTNCNFWANPGHIALLRGNTQVTLGDCHFVDVPSKDGAILAERGRLIVHSCNFSKRGIAIGLKPGVSSAVIMGNLQPGGLQVRNEIATKAQIGMNEAGPPLPADPLHHYRVSVGAPGDDKFLTGGWYNGEEGSDGPTPDCTSRWSKAKCGLKLPVATGVDYDLVIWVNIRPNNVDPANSIALAGGQSVAIDKPGLREIRFSVPKALTEGGKPVEVAIDTKTWNPHKVDPKDNDDRELGMRVYWVEMVAADAKDTGAADGNGGL